jgi:hypothetical protein
MEGYEGYWLLCGHLVGNYIWQNEWMAEEKTKNKLVCLVHCLLYTSAIFMSSFWWCPWEWMGLTFVFWCHFFMDYFALAREFMEYMEFSDQSVSATKPHNPWSIHVFIMADNTFHLLILAIVVTFYKGI